MSTEAFIDSKDAEAVFRVNGICLSAIVNFYQHYILTSHFSSDLIWCYAGKRISRDEMVKPKEKEKPKVGLIILLFCGFRAYYLYLTTVSFS